MMRRTPSVELAEVEWPEQVDLEVAAVPTGAVPAGVPDRGASRNNPFDRWCGWLDRLVSRRSTRFARRSGIVVTGQPTAVAPALDQDHDARHHDEDQHRRPDWEMPGRAGRQSSSSSSRYSGRRPARWPAVEHPPRTASSGPAEGWARPGN